MYNSLTLTAINTKLVELLNIIDLDEEGKRNSHALFTWPVSLLYLVLTVITLNIGTPRTATVVVLNIKQFNFTMK